MCNSNGHLGLSLVSERTAYLRTTKQRSYECYCDSLNNTCDKACLFHKRKLWETRDSLSYKLGAVLDERWEGICFLTGIGVFN